MPHACQRARSLPKASALGHIKASPLSVDLLASAFNRELVGGAGGQLQSESRDLGWMAWGQFGITFSLLKKSPKHSGFCCNDAASCLVIPVPVWLDVGLWLFLTYSGRLTEVPFCGVSLMQGRCLPEV